MKDASVSAPAAAARPLMPESPAGWLSAAVFLISAASATVGILGDVVEATYAAAGLMWLYLALEAPRIPATQRLIALALMLVGGGLAWYGGRPGQAFLDASDGALLFLVLFGAVTFIQYPALRSPSMHHARQMILQQPPGRRYLAVSAAAHCLGALVNFAAMTLLATFLHQALETDVRRRMGAAMCRGFAIAATWSPFFVSMAVILSVMPDLNWSDIALPGFPLGLLVLAYGWLFDRATRGRRAKPRANAQAAEAVRPAAFGRLAVLAVMLVALVLAVAEGGSMPMPLAIFLVVPGFSLAWLLVLRKYEAAGDGSVPGFTEHIRAGLPGLRGEVLLFLAANVLGQGIASAVDPGTVEGAMQAAGLTGPAAIFALLIGMLACAAMAIHPLVLIVVLAHVLDPQRLGLTQQSLALIMACFWGLGAVLSPASGLTLFMARTLGEPQWRVAWVRNGAYSALGALVCGAYVSIFNAFFA
ncbi:hypothetical protein DRB17_08930 [Ferruginivarius sediminum]|uniref:Citrate transporter n=2 Tax=Ferruginivarius sediminum TaxID=2661937 RepID=A0A369TAP1_9PROT|nr:hypothetical protein DRB17_08930 [Ferruginivarius sediminum]